jgi:CubicO group peptidase (beta-lactamase class C family)
VTDLQDRVQQAVDDLVGSGTETGVQVAAYQYGELIVDVCAGLADARTGRPVTPDTPFFSFSTGKGIATTLIHALAEQGQLSYDLRLAEVWPEFGQHGKDGVTVRHVLTHSAGVPALPPEITVADFADWDGMCALLADTTPIWPPGTQSGYHAWTYGWLVGEVARRVTGRPISQLLAEVVAAPLDVTGEVFFAVPLEHLPRLARIEDGTWGPVLPTLGKQIPHFADVVPRGVWTDAALANNPQFLGADVPAGGTITARAAARVYAALLGSVDGVRLIGPDRLRTVTEVATSGPDWTFGVEIPMGLGYDVGDGRFGMGGTGGSIAYAYPSIGLTVAATKNRLGAGDGDPMERLATFIVDSL